MLEAVIILLPELVNPLENNPQTNIPANTNNGYGSEPELIFKALSKKRVNTTVMITGCNTAQAMPSTVCLYLTFISRQVKK